MYVFISTSFVPIAYTVSSCTGFKAQGKYSSISVDCHNDPGGKLLATLVMLIRLQDTVVNASACIRTVCVCELCTYVCAVLGYSVCQGICSLLHMCLLESEG